MKRFEAYDRNRATFTETSIICLNGTEDIYLDGFEKIGRRHIARIKRFNDQGVEVSGFVYISELSRAIKAGTAEVIAK